MFDHPAGGDRWSRNDRGWAFLIVDNRLEDCVSLVVSSPWGATSYVNLEPACEHENRIDLLVDQLDTTLTDDGAFLVWNVALLRGEPGIVPNRPVPDDEDGWSTIAAVFIPVVGLPALLP